MGSFIQKELLFSAESNFLGQSVYWFEEENFCD